MNQTDESMNCTEQVILSRIGRPVEFRYPGAVGTVRGILEDRSVLASASLPVPYWDVVDLIQFEGQTEAEWLRIGYYLKSGERLVWGSQTTITEPVGVWKRLLVHAAREKPWFRQILDDVMAELSAADEQKKEATTSEA